MPHVVPLDPNKTLLVVLHVMSHHAFDNDATNPSPHMAIQLRQVNAMVPPARQSQPNPPSRMHSTT